MKNIKTLIIGILIFVAIAFCILSFVLYNKNNVLNSENNKLMQDIDRLSQEKEVLINEGENLKSKVGVLESELSILEEDVANIYKGCILQNACKGRYPNIRWYCNNVGDPAEGSNA